MLALLIGRHACHSNRSRHTLHKFFSSLAGLFETARRCVQRTREVGNVQAGGSATLGQGRSAHGIREGILKLPFVFRQRRACQ